jgi:hypothetical protein
MARRFEGKTDSFRLRCSPEWSERLHRCAEMLGEKSASAWVVVEMERIMDRLEKAYASGKAATENETDGA